MQLISYTCLVNCHLKCVSPARSDIVFSSVQAWGQVQLTKYSSHTKYPKYLPSTSTGQVLIFFKST